jgi:hypothetical protein
MFCGDLRHKHSAMEENYTTEAFVLVFKTNINHKKDVKLLGQVLDAQSDIISWNVDLSDIDNVLRIESTFSDCSRIQELVTRAGYHCEELTD